jgi:hypothetical protein
MKLFTSLLNSQKPIIIIITIIITMSHVGEYA